MKKKIKIRASILICLIGLILAGDIAYDTEKMMLYAQEEKKNTITDLNHEFSIILQGLTREDCNGYAIDESFLLWMSHKYGDSVIVKLAQTIETDSMIKEVWYQLTKSSINVLWLMYCRDLNYQTYRLEYVSWISEQQKDENQNIVMDFVGDINLDDSWYTMKSYEAKDKQLDLCIDPLLQKELQAADLTMANNEFTYSTRGKATEEKAYCFRANPQNIDLLSQMGVDIVSLANNHVCDYGDKALEDTIKTINEKQMDYVGAGMDIEEAKHIQYYVIGGRKIAIVSATQIEKYYNYTKEATEESPGVLKTLDPTAFLSVISTAKKNSDYVVCYVHWGIEGMLWATQEECTLAKQFADAGADAIIGNHAHRLQGVEFIKNVPVLYGIGNFWFSTGDIYATVAQIQIDPNGNLMVAMLPCRQKDTYTYLLTEQEQKDGFYQYVADLSAELGIDKQGFLHGERGKKPEEIIASYTYASGQNYKYRTGGTDLAGNKIDIVGNLMEE